MDNLLHKNYAEKVTSANLSLKDTCRTIQYFTHRNKTSSKFYLNAQQSIM